MVKITGLDKLQRQLKDAQTVLAALDGDIGQVSFDPQDEASIAAAIQEMERMIDSRVGPYANNPIVAPLVAQSKKSFGTRIRDRAAALRGQGQAT